MQSTSALIIIISILLILEFNCYIAIIRTSNSFFSEKSKLVIVAILKLVFFIFVFCLFLFIYLVFLLNNLFSVSKKSIMSFLKSHLIIFSRIISFSILTIVIFIGNLGWFDIVEEKPSYVYNNWIKKLKNYWSY